MSTFFENWEVIAAIATGCWATFAFVVTRNRELAWKRTEFIVQQLSYFDSDPEMVEGTQVLYGIHPEFTIERCIASATPPFVKGDAELVLRFEKYLNFLWRIGYAYSELKTLTRKDLWAFGDYFWRISQNPALCAFCREEGFEEILTAAQALGYSEPTSAEQSHPPMPAAGPVSSGESSTPAR